MAVLLVIIPEEIARIILEINSKSRGHILLKKSPEWEVNAELKIATMKIKELRLLAKHLQLFGYSSETADKLRTRILKKIPSKLPI